MKLQFLWDCLELIFPKSCPSCHSITLKNEPLVCLRCLSTLSKKETKSILHVNGKAYNVYSAFKFQRKGKVQKLIHEFKYNSYKEIGEFFAERLSPYLQQINHSNYIIPVPIHWEKEKIRGYNQSYILAKKLAEINNLKIVDDALIRKDNNQSQTKKSRYRRFSEIENAFALQRTKVLENEHLILIDDIVTTVATISACIEQLEKIDGVKISVICIAN